MQEHHLSVTKTARYYTLGRPGGQVEQLWFVLHGYGQLAQYFIKSFDVLDDGRKWVVAPEGLSRFYLNGFSGRIGATWMTREDRLHEIDDYLHYLDAVYREVMQRIAVPDVQVVLLGFSQGSATACRWATRGQVKPARLILWAGLIPPELKDEAQLAKLRQMELTLVLGEKDPLADPETIEKQQAFVTRHRIPVHIHTFAGGHEIDPEVLKQLSQ